MKGERGMRRERKEMVEGESRCLALATSRTRVVGGVGGGVHNPLVLRGIRGREAVARLLHHQAPARGDRRRPMWRASERAGGGREGGSRQSRGRSVVGEGWVEWRRRQRAHSQNSRASSET